MALDILESAPLIEQLENFINKIRPNESLRDKLDITYKIIDQSVIVYEIWPHFRDKSQKIKVDIAKATYVRTRTIWKIFWLRADLKWHTYEPTPSATKIKHFLDIIKENKLYCFCG